MSALESSFDELGLESSVSRWTRDPLVCPYPDARKILLLRPEHIDALPRNFMSGVKMTSPRTRCTHPPVILVYKPSVRGQTLVQGNGKGNKPESHIFLLLGPW